MTTKEPQPKAASAAPSESAAAGGEKLIRVRWDTKRHGHKLKFQYADGHPATWDSDGTEEKVDDYPVATVPESFWQQHGKDIRAWAGGTFTVLAEEG